MLIPDIIYTIFEEYVDNFINHNFGVTCLLVSIVKEPCSICNGNAPIRGPWSQSCQVCGGTGFIETKLNSTVKLIIEHERRKFQNIEPNLTSSVEGISQIIGFTSDLPNIRRADYLVIHSDTSNYTELRYKLYGEPHIDSLRGDRYFIGYIQRII